MTPENFEESKPHQGIDVDELNDSLRIFSFADYAVFCIMLVSCSIIGIYFGYKDHQMHKHRLKHRRDSDAMEYLMGGRNMSVFPVAMSLVASFVSGITLLGTSTEIYLYGTQYCYIFIAIFLSAVCMHYTVIPVFRELEITSTYEYLQARFDRNVRLFGSAMFSIATMLWMPIVIYVPALAFNQTTGINIHVITPIVMAICIFYTCVGGLRAVVWTDVIQIFLMYGILFLIVFKGTMDVGGLSVVIQRNFESGRFESPDFRIDPTIRHTFWTTAIGGTIFWINVNGLNQNMIQRYMSLKDVRTARKAQVMYVIGVTIMICLCSYNGLLLFARYHDCDPLITKLAKEKDQLMPLMAMEILKGYTGLSGVFIAGVFSAALSSLSTGLNSMSCVILEDFCKPFLKNQISERMSGFIMRGTVVVLGIISVVLVYVVQHLGSVLQLSMSIPTACFGPLLGVYTVGFFLPWIGKRATLTGALVAWISMMIIVFKAQAEIALGHVKFETKPTSVEGCTYNFTNEISATTEASLINESGKSIYHVSYLYYTLLGSGIVVISSFIFSFIFGFQDSRQVDPRLLAPFMRKYIKSVELKEKCMMMNEAEMVAYNSEIKECIQLQEQIMLCDVQKTEA